MIRWRHAIGRLVIVAAALGLFCLAAGPLAGWCTVRALQSATGAKVDIAATEIGLFPPRICFSGVQVADPRKEMRNAFQADRIELVLDGRALLQRRYEVHSGRISGVVIGGDRSQSGHLDATRPEPADATGRSVLAGWCSQLADDAQNQLEQVADQLRTVREAERIRQHWEAEYADLRQRAERLEEEIERLKSTARTVENPLRDLPEMEAALRRAEEVRQQLIAVHQRLEAMPTQVRADLASLDEAKQADRERIAAYVPDGIEGSPAEIAPELLEAMVRDHLQRARRYLESGRNIASATVAGPEAERHRGESVVLASQPRPNWLIQRCGIDGLMTVDGDRFDVTGILENVTSQTDRLDGPMRARLRLEGPRVVRIDYRRHYDSAVARDALRIHWPGLELPATRLGGDDAALVVDGGRLELWVDLEAVGDRISGRLVSKQSGTRLELATRPELGQSVVVRTFQQSLEEIDHVDVEASFAGTWRGIDMQVRTNLTSALAGGTKRAVAAQVEATRQQLAVEVQRIHQEQTQRLEDWLRSQHADTRSLLAKTEATIDATRQKLLGELKGPEAYVGDLRSRIRLPNK